VARGQDVKIPTRKASGMMDKFQIKLYAGAAKTAP